MPNELSALANGDAVPIESIGIRLRFGVTWSEDAYFCVGAREASCFGICATSGHVV